MGTENEWADRPAKEWSASKSDLVLLYAPSCADIPTEMHPGEKSRYTEFGTMCAEMAENYRAEMNAALDAWAADGFRFGKPYDNLVQCAEYLPTQARIIAQATETEARHGRL